MPQTRTPRRMSTRGEPKSGFGDDVDRLNKIARIEREQIAKVRKNTPQKRTVMKDSSLLASDLATVENTVTAPKRARGEAVIQTIRNQADAERRNLARQRGSQTTRQRKK